MIYLTPYDPATLKCTGASTDSGFASFDEVRMIFGEPDGKPHSRMLTYEGVAYTDFQLSTERNTCNLG